MRAYPRLLPLELRVPVRDGLHGKVHGGVESGEQHVPRSVKGGVEQPDAIELCPGRDGAGPPGFAVLRMRSALDQDCEDGDVNRVYLYDDWMYDGY